MRETHYDSVSIQKHKKTPEGFLQCFVDAARTGELEYEGKDGQKRIEFIEKNDLFKEDSFKSLFLKPIPIEHPGRLTPVNTLSYLKGVTGQVIVTPPPIDDRGQCYLRIWVTIFDQDTIDLIESGALREVSCSYECDTELQPDGKYRQFNRVYNHLALTEDGRCGDLCKVRMDSSRSQFWKLRNDMKEKKEKKEVVVQGKKFSVTPELYNALEAYKAEVEEQMGEDGIPIDDEDGIPIDDEELEEDDEELEEDDRKGKDKRQDSMRYDREMAELETGNEVLRAELDAIKAKYAKLLAKFKELEALLESRQDSNQVLLSVWEKARPLLVPELEAGTSIEGLNYVDGRVVFEDNIHADSLRRAVLEQKNVQLTHNDSRALAIAFDLVEVVDPVLTLDRVVRSDARNSSSDKLRQERIQADRKRSRQSLNLSLGE